MAWTFIPTPKFSASSQKRFAS
ncbi:hypothetical protein PENANT_c001G04817 [Penicillium antarcticum]|uniref:Uncharacterized protein n=1 Tax=Penicillium antarcticum TaxID=416450 RepID=A0A1V6QNJ5_9EURO|nr:hypothetical protein PENANT_c001G04817 [Penicillium antarcticum]